MNVLDEVRFWRIVLASEARTIICSPENESRVKGFIDARDLRGIYKVKVSLACTDTSIYMIDEGAIEASLNESLSRMPPIWPSR